MEKKNFKIGQCKKCGLEFYVHDHHIMPKANFGKNGETITLCPNCHTHIHVYMELNVKDKNNYTEVYDLWEYWLKFVKVGIITALILAVGVGIYQLSSAPENNKTEQVSSAH